MATIAQELAASKDADLPKRAALASPGADPTRVTDEHIMHAIGVLFNAPNAEETTTVGKPAQ